jgi:hypothetical protein
LSVAALVLRVAAGMDENIIAWLRAKKLCYVTWSGHKTN